MIPVTDETWGKKITGNPAPILVTFYYRDNDLCKPVLERLEREEKNYPTVQFYSADVTNEKEDEGLRLRSDIRELPAVQFIIAGNTVTLVQDAKGLSQADIDALFGLVSTMI